MLLTRDPFSDVDTVKPMGDSPKAVWGGFWSSPKSAPISWRKTDGMKFCAGNGNILKRSTS
eukprot:5192703-Heterocapsa_arctica.AAC.1